MADWVRVTDRLPEVESTSKEPEYWIILYEGTKPVLADYWGEDTWWVAEWDGICDPGDVEWWAPGIRPTPPDDAGQMPWPGRQTKAHSPEPSRETIDGFLSEMNRAIVELKRALKDS